MTEKVENAGRAVDTLTGERDRLSVEDVGKQRELNEHIFFLIIENVIDYE